MEKIKAIVTGHSKGLGAGICEALLKRDIDVLGLSRSQFDQAGRRDGLLEYLIDLSDTRAVLDWLNQGELTRFAQNTSQFILVNNAGVLGPVSPCQRQSSEKIANAVSLNVAVPLMLSAAVAQLEQVHEKRVVHISSGAARNAYPGWSIYCATKAALDHHARAVAMDDSPGLKVVSLAPGVIDTQMQTEIRGCSVNDFPNLERFQAMKTQGQLNDAGSAGARVVEYVLSPAFGQVVVDDLRG